MGGLLHGVADEGWKDFATVLKYFRHTLEGFARDGGGGRGGRGLEEFCTGIEIS